ncbi:MAG: glycosyltransferase [Deltaproteobacteria bacterium]|nr:glycosyltransferase [Deltaproteobacteria bacterium]
MKTPSNRYCKPALARRLNESGHEVHMLASRWKSEGENIRFHRVAAPRGPAFLQILWFAMACKRLTSGNEYDIVHSFERTLGQDVYRAGDGCHKEWLIQRAKADPALKRVSYGFNPLHLTYLYLEKRLFSEPALKKVIANSNRGKAEIMAHYGVDTRRIRVIHNGFNPDLLDAPSEPLSVGNPADRFALFVGSGYERKGLATAIQCLALLGDSRVKLLVVGKDRPGRFEKLASRSGVADRVLFCGPQKNVAPFYRRARCFILPTLYEPFSNACLEAAAFGLPVVTTRMNGFSELIKEGVNGYILENPLDIAAAATALESAIEQGRVAPGELPTLEENVRSTLEIYEEILEST